MRQTQNGASVANFNVATTARWKDKQGQQHEETEWHKVTAWQKLAKVCDEYLQKGAMVYVEGAIKTNKWQSQDGQDRSTTQIVAKELKMLSPHQKESNNASGPADDIDACPF